MIRVIVADDEPKVSQLICSLVDWQALGMQVMAVAANGIEALEQVRLHQPHLLITDIRMPGCDGLELVKRAKALQPGLDIIIISGYRYFEYAQTAIQYGVSDYLLKPVNQQELLSTLEKMREKHLQRTQQLSETQQMRRRMASDMRRRRAELFTALAEGAEIPASVAALNQTYDYGLRPGEIQLCLVKIDGDYDTLNEGAQGVVGDKSEPILREAFRPLCNELEVWRRGTLLAALLNYDGQAGREIRRAARSALDDIRVQNSIFPGAVFTMVLSQPCDAAGLPLAFASAMEAMAGRLFGAAGSLLDAKHPTSEPAWEVPQQLVVEAVRSIEQGLELQDLAAVQAAVQSFAENLKAQPLTGTTLLRLVQDVFGDTLALLRKAGLPLAHGDAAQQEFVARMDVCATREAVMACLAEGVNAVVAGALAQKQGEDAKPIRVAKQYIHEHYMNPITLEEVSGAAGFNASYFSSLFKKETGQNFLEYLSEVRMARAKELLRDSDFSIAKICEEVGYNDLKYFTKSFKKATGVKPGEFRKLYS